MLFTIGILLALLCILPFFFYELNHSANYLTFSASIATICLSIVWISISIKTGLKPSRISIASPFSINYAQAIGIISLNLGSAVVFPSWTNLKASDANIHQTVWSLLGTMDLFYITIGIFFAMAFDIEGNNVLQTLAQYGTPLILSKISIAIYATAMLLPSVPVYTIISEHNLKQSNLIGGSGWITFFAYIFPILLSIPLQTGNYIFFFLSWTSLFFNMSVNFILPLVLYLQALSFRRNFKLSRNQIEILFRINSRESGRTIDNQQENATLMLNKSRSSLDIEMNYAESELDDEGIWNSIPQSRSNSTLAKDVAQTDASQEEFDFTLYTRHDVSQLDPQAKSNLKRWIEDVLDQPRNHPGFFRAIPLSFPISSHLVCQCLLFFSVALSVFNIAILIKGT